MLDFPPGLDEEVEDILKRRFEICEAELKAKMKATKKKVPKDEPLIKFIQLEIE